MIPIKATAAIAINTIPSVDKILLDELGALEWSLGSLQELLA